MIDIGEDKGLDEVKKVRQLCEEIFLDYQVKVGEKHSKEIKAICNSEFNHEDEMDSLDGFFSWNIESSDANEKFELDCYLEEKLCLGVVNLMFWVGGSLMRLNIL